jgi:hypothetical protein
MEWPTLLTEPLNVSEATTHGVSEKPEPERDEGHEEADVPEPPVGSTLEGREPTRPTTTAAAG